MKIFYDENRKCYVDESGRYVRKPDPLDPTVIRDGYFFSKEDEGYLNHLKIMDDSD